MTTTAPDPSVAAPSAVSSHTVPTGLRWLASDIRVEAGRHLIATKRNPDLLVFATIQPIMFVVLFVYVFGGAITVPGYSSYQQFVVPGIFAQTVVFGSAFTGIGIAEDMQKGFIDRLRSLPMYPSAVLVGRTTSDLVRNTFTFAIMMVVGLIVGFTGVLVVMGVWQGLSGDLVLPVNAACSYDTPSIVGEPWNRAVSTCPTRLSAYSGSLGTLTIWR